MERGLFYLPCGNNVDDMPPSFEGWYNPHQRWNGWYAPLFNKETYDKICAYYSDPKTNTQESIDDLKEFMDADKNHSVDPERMGTWGQELSWERHIIYRCQKTMDYFEEEDV